MRYSTFLVIAAVTLLPAPARTQMRAVGTTVAPGVHVVSGFTNGNVLVIEGRSGLVLVDAQSAQRVEALDSAMRTLTAKPVIAVINTHYHEDHIGGNGRWAGKGARVIAHRDVPVEARRDTFIAARQWQRTPTAAENLPTTLFDDSTTVQLDDETIHIYHRAAHTGGDAIIWMPSRNVLHAGDIVEIGAPPFIDWWTGGTMEGMVSAVDFMHRLANDTTRIVPGHGSTIDRAMLRSYRMQLLAAAAACGGNKDDAPAWACPPDPQPGPTAALSDVETPDAIVAALYEVISGPAGRERDWSRFRSLFVPGVRLVRTEALAGGGSRIVPLTPEQYIEWAGPRVVERGYYERELSRQVEHYGPVYQAFSTFEARIPAQPTDRIGRGINTIQLRHDGRRWWIIGLSSTAESANAPLPAKYLQAGGGK